MLGRLPEVGDRSSLTEVKLILDLHDQSVARPRLLQRFARIPAAQFRCLELRQERANVEPGQLVSSLLTNSTFWAFLSEKPHVLEV